jgi:hypothetical protein
MNGREGKSFWISIMRSKHDTNFFFFYMFNSVCMGKKDMGNGVGCNRMGGGRRHVREDIT